MLVVFHNRYHPRIRLPRPDVRQPSERSGAIAFRLVAWFLLAGLLVLAALTFYDIGRQQAGFDSGQARKQRRELSQRLKDAENERDELLQRVASLTRTLQIDREAARQVRQSLLELQDERLQLKEEIAFLSSLLSDGKTKAGLRVRRFVLEPLDEAGSFRYRFGLSKFPQDGDELRATLELTVIGKRGGTESSVVYKDAALGEKKGKLAFKQLVQVEGALKLPSGFKPQRLKIVVKPEKGDVVGVEREFSWVVGS